jgi:hypothetical protein
MASLPILAAIQSRVPSGGNGPHGSPTQHGGVLDKGQQHRSEARAALCIMQLCSCRQRHYGEEIIADTAARCKRPRAGLVSTPPLKPWSVPLTGDRGVDI